MQRFPLYLLLCAVSLLLCAPAHAVVKPPMEWFDSPEKETLWNEMAPILNEWEFGEPVRLLPLPEESAAGISRFHGRSNESVNAAVGETEESPEAYNFDLNMDGVVNHFDLLELGYETQPATKRTSIAPSTGTNQWIVLRADFQDQDANYGNYGVSYFEERFFSDGTAPKPSCNDYFQEVSYGQLNIDGTIAGSGTGGDGWFKGEQTKQWYIDNGGRWLVREAVLAADAEIDFSDFDVDGDGYVDTCVLFYPNAVFSGGLWPHRSSGLNIHVDGVIVDSYFITGYAGDDSWTMTITCHEYGHILGLPDLYDTNGGSQGLGAWSLMAYQYNGNQRVPSPDPWCKSVLGWVTPEVITENVVGYSCSCYQDEPKVLKVWSDGKQGDQYFLLANYQQKDNDSERPGEGLMIFHVDDSIGGGNSDNQNEFRKHVDVESARGYVVNFGTTTPEDPLDAQWDLGNSQDPFFFGNVAGNYTGVFDDASNPYARDYPHLGNNTSVSVFDISAPGDTMTFSINVRTPDAPTVQITSPLTGDTIGGDVLLEATATPAGGRTISRVEFYCNSAYLGQDSSAPYSLTFDSRCIYEGSRQLKAIAVDSAGAIHTDTEVVTLANNAVPLPQSDDFEAGIGAWASYNPSGNRRWEEKPQFFEGAKSGGIGATSGGYDYDEHDSFVTIRYDLSDIERPQARWQQRYRVSGGENTCKAFITADDGESFQLLKTWTSSNLAWHPEAVNLDDYIGEEVHLVFKLDSSALNRATGEAGWWIDNFEIRERSQPPQITSVTPIDGSTLLGDVPITVEATDDEGITRVDFLLDGELLFTDYSAPFEYPWNSDWVFNGEHSFSASAYDADLQSAVQILSWETINPGRSLPFSESFEELSSAWRIIDDNGSGKWNWMANDGYLGSPGMYMGDLNLIPRRHDDNENDWLISPTLAMPFSGQMQLSFLHRYDIEATYDFGRMYLTTDLNSWTQFDAWSLENQPWQMEAFDLAPYSGKKVKLAWFFEADGGVVEEGWYVDDIIVHGGPWIEKISPNPANAGDEIHIIGQGFGSGDALDAPKLFIAGNEVTPLEWSEKGIRAIVPGGIGSSDVMLECRGAQSEPFRLQIRIAPTTLDDIGQLNEQ